MKANALPKSLIDNPLLGSWISVAPARRIAIGTGKVELGQGIATALAQIAAEELGIAVASIDVLAADTDRSPNEGLTAGSQSVEVSGASLRLAAAQARQAFLQAAAARLGVSITSLSAQEGNILQDGTATPWDYWSLAAEVDWLQPITGTAPVRSFRDHRVVGRNHPRIDLADKLAQGGFIHDMVTADMLHVRVVRQPWRGAALAAVEEAWLRHRYPGVAILRKTDFLALVGKDEYQLHAAHQDAPKFVTWTAERDAWQPAVAAGPTHIMIGAPATELADGARRLSARYSRGYIAHASIGPSCALAQFQDGRLTVWCHSQGIFTLRDQIAKCLALSEAQVRLVHVPGAGCYGHNGADDAALDAAIVAQAMPGQVVRVQWSRGDELSLAPLGAAMATTIEAALDDAGHIASWKISVVSAPHAQRPGFGGYANLSSAEALDRGAVPRTAADLPEAAGGGASRNAVALYDFPHQDVTVRLETQSRIRTSSLRSLGAHLNVFAIESAMDELAALAGTDPLEFRLRHLRDARCRAVLTQVAEMSEWPQTVGVSRALGLALSRYKNKGAWLAAVAEVSVDEMVRVERLWLSVDAGPLINPAGARNQIEGGAIQAVSWTLKEEVPIENDRVAPLDWQTYPILKFSEVPAIETRFIVDPMQQSLGVGEAAQGPVAAAIGNAVARALGARLRDLPLTRDRLLKALLTG